MICSLFVDGISISPIEARKKYVPLQEPPSTVIVQISVGCVCRMVLIDSKSALVLVMDGLVSIKQQAITWTIDSQYLM